MSESQIEIANLLVVRHRSSAQLQSLVLICLCAHSSRLSVGTVLEVLNVPPAGLTKYLHFAMVKLPVLCRPVGIKPWVFRGSDGGIGTPPFVTGERACDESFIPPHGSGAGAGTRRQPGISSRRERGG
ncbi:predicted protein [Coccidioides posadasii str. Silveira]|uniref:Predicted protein n=1 Tax=Coccidioides posadasii (strain RMSCC 757 / Silveira) TaxID=443226 RepID=E9CR68_COCPS|nr:predicted protein [Coccidioides posadasii str. Silveira]